jgi:hypothetical protein
VYEDAPDAVNVALAAEHIKKLGVKIVTFGAALTVIVCVVVFVQPFVAVPITVYVVVVNGETVIVAPDKFPGIQLYEDAPLAVIEVLFPAQIVPDVVVVVTVGIGFTDIVLIAVFVQPFIPVPVTV